jgi:hypothetical protein
MAGAIARPIRRAAKATTAIGNLDFAEVVPLAGSHFREIDRLARSFNAMLDGLRAFGRYVPRTLVMRLVKEGRVGAGTEERVLAIMFTDIVSSHRCPKKCPPPRWPTSSINISRSSQLASNGRAAQSISSLAML